MTRPTMTAEQYEKLLNIVVETNNSLVRMCKRLTAMEEFHDFTITEFQTQISQIEQVQNNIDALAEAVDLQLKPTKSPTLMEMIRGGDLYIEGITEQSST